nr:GNAT family N-acetyltransferase [Oscillochloris sp. ZM17-4]
MAHIDGDLAGVAQVGHGPESEICLCVDPARRRRGAGRALVTAARGHVAARGAGDILLVSDTTAESGPAFAESLGAQLSFAEHRMDLDLAAVPAAPVPMPDLDIRPAHGGDAPAIAAVLVAAFGDPPAMVERFVAERIVSRSHRFLLGELVGRPAGTLRLIVDDGWTYVSTFGVLPALHGRGVGRRMLLHTIGLLLADGQRAVRIEVDTTNASAIGLYESCGFRRGRTFAYHRLPELAPSAS